jgi:hypothetical protein
MTADTTARWPFVNDHPLTRSRRAALAYRAALRLNNRSLCDQIDQTLVGYGETWVVEAEVTIDTDGLDEVTTTEAAELAHVPAWQIRHWAATPDPDRPGRMLLPTFGKRGKQNTYLARDVAAVATRKKGPVGLPPIDPH